MSKPLCASSLLSILLLIAATAQGQAHELHTFRKVQLSDAFYGEGASFGDVNGDGTNDIVSGPFWYAGPDFKTKHEIYPPKKFNPKGYSDNFFSWVHDINGDKRGDVIVIGFPGKQTHWFENPGAGGFAKHWKKHVAMPVTDNESPGFGDLTGDGKPELIFHTAGTLGWAEPYWDKPTVGWKFHKLSPKGRWGRFTHGLGYGDVNGDGRVDVLERAGWWEQPKSLDGDPAWKHHKVNFGAGGAQMHVYDVDGDGDNDVITSIRAHAYGLSWFEQFKDGDAIRFREHRIMGDKADHNPYGVVFSQMHAIDLVDMDGDGLKDIVTGKRFWAHNGKDPGGNDPAVLYWFKLTRKVANKGPGVEFVPHVIDNDSGVGTQVLTGDVDGNGLSDIVVGNKKGTFVHLHSKKKVSKEEWQRAQPLRRMPDTSLKSLPGIKSTTGLINVPGVLPLGKDGKPMNVDFETGTLKDWVATGDAWRDQPVKGPIDQKRIYGKGKVADHQGNYWIGGFEIHRDGPKGTLTSKPFKVTHPWASFRVAGGSHAETRVELVRKDSGDVFFRRSGTNTERMVPVAANLQLHEGKEIFIRIVDQHSAGWGHMNFDDFRFHKTKPAFAKSTKSTPPPPPVKTDQFNHEGLAPEAAAKAMTVPKGFSVKLFAGEPDVKQPIAMAIDDRGRLWVAEAYSYPFRVEDNKARDRILIFEDTDGDGRFDKRKVFIDKLNLISGIEVGFGGVWVGAAPYLMFIPDRNGDDKPDGKPEILLDGWGHQDTHETLNAFIWGPDGWLYGCHGVFTHSKVGKPGTPDDKRTKINAGIWRYHPTKHEFEVFAWGTSNPWGIDFDDRGQAFATACVIPHLFHIIQGGRYRRQAGTHFNKNLYQYITTIADHRHYVGQTPHGGNNRSDSTGGGHAHAGAMIYLGGKWPKEYRNRIFMNNIHGARINVDVLKRKGSGFVGSHGPDFCLANDRWSQIINLRYGPDGDVYMIDWYDKNQCHRREANIHDRSNGRIFKVTYGKPKTVNPDLASLSDEELAMRMLDDNVWYARHARRILQERAAKQGWATASRKVQILPGGIKLERGPGVNCRMVLWSHLTLDLDVATRLRSVWALHATGGLSKELVIQLLQSGDEYIRAWVIQLELEDRRVSPTVLKKLAEMARNDPSPVVRLYLAAALQRLPIEQRWPIAERLVQRGEDADDHNIPLMIWYGIEPAVAVDPVSAAKLITKTKIPQLRQFIARRMAAK